MRSAAIIALLGVASCAYDIAYADVSISGKPTANMDCEAGVCTATAQKAVLNVGDLQAMLASGDVAVRTGALAKDIDIDQPLIWATTSRLTLDAQASVTVNKQVTVSGTGNLAIVTNDNGGTKSKNKTGEFIIVPEHGSVQFWDSASSLIIDGKTYTLVGDIKTLAADIAANPSGTYALAKPYDASVDGTYSSSPVPTTFTGTFDGLGNSISNLAISFSPSQNGVLIGLFSFVQLQGVIQNIAVKRAILKGTGIVGDYGAIGILVGDNRGTILDGSTSGTISIPGGGNAGPGGLVGQNDGTITQSRSAVETSVEGAFSHPGALVAYNKGEIIESFAEGTIRGQKDNVTQILGGLVGQNVGLLRNTYAVTKIHQPRGCCESLGGLVGANESTGRIESSYAAGQLKLRGDGIGDVGGLIGTDNAPGGSIANAYWDLDKGVGGTVQGAGNILNDPGITGLTDAQLKSGLPKGFDPKVWGSNPKINNGYPYLLANPPH